MLRALLVLALIVVGAVALLVGWQQRYSAEAARAEQHVLAALTAGRPIDPARYHVGYPDAETRVWTPQLAVDLASFRRALRSGRYRVEPQGTFVLLGGSRFLTLLLPKPRYTLLRTADGGLYEVEVLKAPGEAQWKVRVSNGIFALQPPGAAPTAP